MGEEELTISTQDSLEKLMQTWHEEGTFDGWSDKQLQVFKADIAANLQGRLLRTKVGDQIIRVWPAFFGKLAYDAATVTEIDHKKLLAKFTFHADIPGRTGIHLLDTGLSENSDPNYGWLAPYDSGPGITNGTKPLQITTETKRLSK